MTEADETHSANLGLSNVAPGGHVEDYVAPLTRWFAARMPDRTIEGIDSFATPSEGLSNETVLFDLATTRGGVRSVDRYVARIQAHGQPLAPPQTDRCSSSIEFEYHLQSAVGAHPGCPVAPIVGFEPDPAFLGRPFFVMECIPGRVPGVQPSFHSEGFMKEEASPAQRFQLAQRTIEAMARLHEIDWRGTELAPLYGLDVAPDLEFHLDIYRKDFAQQLAGRPFPLIEATLDWLSETDPGEQRIGLVWGDARLGNVICSDDYEPAALLDWENGFVGPTDADVGWWMLSDRINHELLAIPRLEGFPTYDEQLALYEEAAGRAVGDVRFWEIFAGLRMAHGVLRLADRMAQSSALPPEMADLGFTNPVTTVVEQLLPRG